MTTLQERLKEGPMICAEGYLFELERRGYCQIGPFVPSAVLDHPHAVLQLHREFLRAGSDVCVAFTYYAHRAKLELVGLGGGYVERLNNRALELAKAAADEVSAESGKKIFVAGNVCNTTVFDPADPAPVRAMFDEQIGWAKAAGVDFIVCETFEAYAEALVALQACQAAGLPAVVNFSSVGRDDKTTDGVPLPEACKRAYDAGAAVVGLNCTRGPETMMPLLKGVCAAVDPATVPVAALPVGYRTTACNPTFQSFSSKSRKYCELDPHTCTRFDFGEFATQATKLGARFIGCCCGGAPHHVRAMAEALGRSPPASAASARLELHFALGDAKSLGAKARPEHLAWGDFAKEGGAAEPPGKRAKHA